MSATNLDRFHAEMQALLKERIGVALVVGSFVFPFFVQEDKWLVPEDWKRVFLVRIACSLTCLLGAALNHTRAARRYPFAFMVLIVAVISVMKTFATALDVTGIRTLYFGGHALILVGGLSFLPITGVQAGVLVGTGILGYVATNLLFATALDPVSFQVQIGLLVAIGVLLSLGCHYNWSLREREFRFRNHLYQVRRRAEDYGWGRGDGA